MSNRIVGMALLGALLALHVEGAQEKTDKERLQGTWLVVSVEKEGQKVESPKDKETTLTFTGDKAAFKSEKKNEEGGFKIDAARKPKEIDLTSSKPGATEAMKGIYDFEGEALRIAFPGKPGGGRPTGFDAKDIVILTLKRKS